MTTLRVEDMHCGKCVERISKVLDAADIKYSVSLEDKSVTIDGCEHCVKTAIDELEDIGFTAVVAE
ncbi:MAG: heavy-metal-associated domain-containing protein [Acetivibrio ethanolgignens]